MNSARRPPRLLVRTIAATFVAVSVLLAVVFIAVTVSVRNQVRETVRAQLEASQRVIAAIESREQRELRLQAENFADSPTLKAAIDTYAAEAHEGNAGVQSQLINTISNELAKVAARADADALVVVDTHRRTLSAAGRLEALWPQGTPVPMVSDDSTNTSDGVVHTAAGLFRVVTVPLLLSDGPAVGTLYLATILDQRFAEQLGALSGTRTAIVSDGRMIASTLPSDTQQAFAAAIPDLRAEEGTLAINGESHAFRRLARIGDTTFYALTSVDDTARAALGAASRALGIIALGALGVALLGSLWLAHRLSEPIKCLSARLHDMGASRAFDQRLSRTGSSQELDALTDTFNALMGSVTAAEAETEAAYTAAIRALAAALDARDPYTAGHSERVSALSVAIGKILELPASELEVVRLGALLHDIGKIGVPDAVLRKPGPLTAAEFDTIKQHTLLGARILRHVPFLSRHVQVVELHHERPDGEGYPYGLHGNDIPLCARIVHVADAYDAITSARAYRRERRPSEAMRELWNSAGTEFDAEIVAALAAALPGVTSQSEAAAMEALSA